MILNELESGHVRPRQGTEICNFGAPSPLIFWIFIQWIFFPGETKIWRKLPDVRAEKKAQSPVTSLAVMIFSAPMEPDITLQLQYSNYLDLVRIT